MLRILRHLAEHQHFTDLSPLQTGTIVYNVEDRPKRYFPEWYSCTIQERKSQTDDVTDDNCKDIVCNLANRLLEIGKGLQNESQEELDLSRFTIIDFFVLILIANLRSTQVCRSASRKELNPLLICLAGFLYAGG